MNDTATAATVFDAEHLAKAHAHIADLLAASEDAGAALYRLRRHEVHASRAELDAAEEKADHSLVRLRRAEARCDLADLLAAEQIERHLAETPA